MGWNQFWKSLIYIFWCLCFHVVFLKYSYYLCLVLLQVAKCLMPFQIFCVGPKIHLHIVPVTNILCQTKRWFAFSKIGFCASIKVFEEALNAVKFLGWLKKFGPAQNILRPVKGQGITVLSKLMQDPMQMNRNRNAIWELISIHCILNMHKCTQYFW